MDNSSTFCYGSRHKTSWQSNTARRSSSPESDRVAALGRDLSKSRLGCEGIGESWGAAKSSLSAERREGLAHEGDSKAGARADAGSDGDANQAFGRRCLAGEVCHRPLDALRGCRPEREAFCGTAWTDGRPACTSGMLRMDLPQIGATGDRTQGGVDRQMEAGRLAGYKKKPGGSALIWSSSTKEASCSLRTFGRLGRKSDIPRSFATAIVRTGSRSSPRSRFLRLAIGSACTSDAAGITSTGTGRSSFSACCCGTSKARSCFRRTAPKSTGT